MSATIDLLIGTSNPGKVREYATLLAEVPARLLSLRDVGLESHDPDEPFPTYAENAAHKALSYARASGLLALADDSGLEVDALDGRPGVYSARYGGGGDRGRYLKLLDEMKAVPDSARGARFQCVVALADPVSGQVELGSGECHGRIAHAPGEGNNGFGYDAVFIADGYDVCFSALPPEAKHAISHRGRAVRALIPRLTMLAAGK
jgi:XTP/dITP diphosphohydrolase